MAHEHLTGQIKTPTIGVLLKITQDVGQLESTTEMMRHAVRFRRRITKDTDGETSNGRGDTVTIKIERCLIGRNDRSGRIHRHTIDDSCKIFLTQTETGNRGEKYPVKAIASLARKQTLDAAMPFLQRLGEIRYLHIAIGDVVDFTTKGVNGKHTVAPFGRQNFHSFGERRTGAGHYRMDML